MSDNNDLITREVMTHLGLPFDMIDTGQAHVATISVPTDYTQGPMHVVSVVWVDDEYADEWIATVRVITTPLNVHTELLHKGRSGR